jgi:glycerophosphoryl diester phosphodiesterase
LRLGNGTRLTTNGAAGFRNRNDRKIYAWTVDDSDSMKRMLYEQVDALVTSNPSLLQQLMQELRTECIEDGFAFP